MRERPDARKGLCLGLVMLLAPALAAASRVRAGEELRADEQTALEIACPHDRRAGATLAEACRERELRELAAVPRPAQLGRLTVDERLRLDAACGHAQTRGPAELRACQARELASLPAHPLVEEPAAVPSNADGRSSMPPQLQDLALIAPAAPPPAPALKPLPPEAIYARVAETVWRVLAARSEQDLRLGRGTRGSAVAVAPHRLLTNCHVVAGASVLGIGQRGQWYPVTVVASDKAADRCTLDSGRLLLVQTAHLRPYASLRVGEKAYSIGAPFGLEQTLGEGLVSGLRRRKGVDYVQTSAPISLGSSGGGLFDAHANLIGITTFLLGGGQQLNFAIAAASYRIE